MTAPVGSVRNPDKLKIEPALVGHRSLTRLTINNVDLLTLQRPIGGGGEPLQFLPADVACLLPPDSPALLPSTVPGHAMVGICGCGEPADNSLWVQVRRACRQVLWEPDPLTPRRTIDTAYHFELIDYLDTLDAAAATALSWSDRPRRIARELRRQRDSLFGFSIWNPSCYYRLLDVRTGTANNILITVAGPRGAGSYSITIPADQSDDDVIDALHRFEPERYPMVGSADWEPHARARRAQSH